MKYKSYKLQKLEKTRVKSLLTNDMEHCYLCGRNKDDIHEIYQGRNRLNSIKYNLIIPLCRYCHSNLHNNYELINNLKKQGQILFEQNYNLNFLSIFYKNYKI